MTVIHLAVCMRLYSQTGMLFGDNHAFYFTAPSGWVLDNKSGVGQGIHMAFYPAGFTYKNSPVFAYGRSTSLTGEIRSVQDLVESTIQEFKNNGSANYSGKKEKTLVLPGGKSAEIYFYSGDRWGNYEAVGYILEKKTINFLVFNCRYRRAFDDHIDKFYEILGSYKNAFQEDAPGYDEQAFRDYVERAELDKNTEPGRIYENRLVSTQAEDLGKLYRECLSYEKEGSAISDIEAVFLIEPDGRIRESYVWPVNALSTCFKGAAASLEIPPHSFPVFHWHVSLKINGRRGSEEASRPGLSRAVIDTTGPKEGARPLQIGNLPPNIFLIGGSYNPYEYWRWFKPGSSVTFRIYSEVGTKKTLSKKKFEVKRLASDKVSISVNGEFEKERALPPDVEFVQGDNSTMILDADMPPWETNDLFDGYLSLNFSDTKLFLDADRISLGKEDLDIGGQAVKTDTYTMTFEYPQVKTTITIWYADSIPGGVARYKRVIQAAGASTSEEITVEQFRPDKIGEAEYFSPALTANTDILGCTYLGKKLRYFEDEQIVEVGWRMFAKVFKEKNVHALLPEITGLQDDALRWQRNFKEDQAAIRQEISEQDWQKLLPFFSQAARYCQSMLDYIAGERELLSMLFNQPEAVDQTYKKKVEDFRNSNDPWGETRDAYIAARNGLKNIRVHIVER